MRISDLLLMSINNLRRRKLRTVLTVLGVIIGTASIVVMVSLGIGLNEMTMEQIESYGSLTTIEVRSNMGYGGVAVSVGGSSSAGSEAEYITDETIEQFARMEHVKGVSPVLDINVIMRQGVYEAQYLTLRGVGQSYLQQIPLGQGRLPKPGETGLVVGNTVIQQFSNAKTGKGYWDTMELPDVDFMGQPLFVIFDMDAYYQSQSGSTESGTTVAPPKRYLIDTCGVVAGGDEEWNSFSYGTYCEIESLKAELKRIFKNKAIPGQPTTQSGKPYKEIFYNQIYVDVDSMENVAEVQSAINAMGYQASSNAEWVESTQTQYRYIQLVLGGIGAVSLLVAAIGITNTMMMSIYERTKEIGIMKVLGCDLRNIQMMFLLEAGYIGLIGGVVGLAFSYGISVVINRVVQSMGNMMTLSYIPPWLALLSLVFAILVGMTAGFFPSLRAMRLSPLAAIRSE